MKNRIERTVLRETAYIAAWVLLLSIAMQAVILLSGYWNYTALLGNLLSGFAAVLNFFLMGITVQHAVGMDTQSAGKRMRASQMLRNLMLFAAAALGVLLPCFDIWTSIIPLFFPRIAIAFRPLFRGGREHAQARDPGGEA